jgi:hypothetical protein
MLGREYPSALRMGSRELDRRLDTLASRGAKECAPQPSSRALAESFRQLAGKIRNMRLDHRRPAPLQLGLQRSHHIGMVVTDIVNAVSRQKIQDAAPVRGEEFGPDTPLVPHIHLQQI